MENKSFAPPNILVVDDANTNLMILMEMIRNAGYIARPVTSVRQAVSAIEALTPNLILLDITMPEIDGFVFCAMLKKNANTRDIPVIFITAVNSVEDKIKAFQLGAVDYIVKPFEAEEVKMRINTHLKMHKMQQELEVYNKKLYKIINDQIHKIYEEQKNVVNSLRKLYSLKYKTKEMYMDRLGKNCRLMAMSLQMTPKYRDLITNSFIDAIELAAPLHDIGTLAISDGIVLKTECLTPEENNTLKSHVTIGANTLEEIYAYNEQNEIVKMAIDIARHHHENWDGTGYPKGISGSDIPLSARITSIIAAYDYSVYSEEERLKYRDKINIESINEGAGILYDPDIVTVLNKIHNQLKSSGPFL